MDYIEDSFCCSGMSIVLTVTSIDLRPWELGDGCRRGFSMYDVFFAALLTLEAIRVLERRGNSEDTAWFDARVRFIRSLSYVSLRFSMTVMASWGRPSL